MAAPAVAPLPDNNDGFVEKENVLAEDITAVELNEDNLPAEEKLTKSDAEKVKQPSTVSASKKSFDNASTCSSQSKKSKNAHATKKSVGSENTGRWTKTEHEAFLAGLEQHGKEWKKIANMIETRTVVQIRTHAQKYFQKIAKTKFESLGKEVPSDLMSTASNTNKGKKSSMSLSDALSAAADVPFGAKRDSPKALKPSQPKPKPIATNPVPPKSTVKTPKKQAKKPLEDPKATTNLKNVPAGRSKLESLTNSKSSDISISIVKEVNQPAKKLKVSEKTEVKLQLEDVKPVLDNQAPPETSLSNEEGTLKRKAVDDYNLANKSNSMLKISTDSLAQRQKNEEEDLKWMVSSMGSMCKSHYFNQPDASPTSVAELGLYKNFGSNCSSESYSHEGSVCDEQDILSLYDGDSLMSEWMKMPENPTLEHTIHNSSGSLGTYGCDLPGDEENLAVDPASDEHNEHLSFDQMDETIAEWINSPEEGDCSLESFSGVVRSRAGSLGLLPL